MKKFFKNKVNLAPKSKEPRQIEEISKDLSREYFELGQVVNQKNLLEQAITIRTSRIQELNNEGLLREQLNKANQPAPQPQPQAGATNEA